MADHDQPGAGAILNEELASHGIQAIQSEGIAAHVEDNYGKATVAEYVKTLVYTHDDVPAGF